MKCKCGREATVQTLHGDRLTIATAYKRIGCSCGLATRWCDVYFTDIVEWLRKEWHKIQDTPHA